MDKFTYKKNSVRTRYNGNTASRYDEKRKKRKKWRKEIEAITKIANSFDPDSTVLDIPAGTGRFLMSLKDASHTVYGIDISLDMLLQAKEKCEDSPVDMIIGDAVTIPLKKDSVDYAVCIRLLNWVMESTMKNILNELRRVSRKGIVIGIRTEKRMDFSEFIRFGIFGVLPTPTSIRKWAKNIKNFTKKAKGKIAHEFRKVIGKQQEKKKIVKNEFFLHTFYNKGRMLRLFSDMETDVIEEIHIDTICSFSKWIVRPYSIYYLEFRD
jgi:ubiquinone/menaquinone biosynthesis C-methylase UbiE